ncbi:25S rRNA (adenine645-N1)-methyltransferase [Diatrype stigma]|uniref:Ribosomal RNA-processing protein 8 n=1 Tax=Diatrype stigma TaxID=117547 RepID=A0AAN9US21_9PEZI
MFAVPGWAVSADGLKVETNKSSAPPAAAAATAAGKTGTGPDDPRSDNNKSKKRKRPNALPSNVTAANVADLWERVIEGKSPKKPKTAKESKKKQQPQQSDGGHVKKSPAKQETDGDEQQQSGKKATKKEKKGKSNGGKQDENAKVAEEDANANADADGAQPEASAKKSKKDKKKNKKNKQAAENQEGDHDEQQQEKAPTAATTTTAATATAAPPPPPAPKLTPMQAAMREKLISARFRHLNETLYTRPSAEAFRLFQESPEMFREYHEGFRRQVDVWPENPVDGYIAEIQLRGRVKTPAAPPRGRGRGRDQQVPSKNEDDAAEDNGSGGSVPPLPRSAKGTCTIADLGCGDAKLAAALEAEPSSRKKQLRVEVLSYDLHGDEAGADGRNPRVTRADIANLPRADGSVDIAVFCLALMGTNWLDFVEEAYRVLRWKGELWVAEIKSRFAAKSASSKKNPGGGGNNSSNGVVSHSVGNRRKPGAAGGKKGGKKNGEDEDGADHEADLAVEVDGAEDRRGETDVSGFVEALRRRGFVLQGEPDLRNRMFVRMRFVKAASATVGKCAAPEAAAALPQQDAHARPGRNNNHHHQPSLAQKRASLKKFLEGDGAEGDRARAAAEEKAILKPCVYKIR